MSFCQPSGMWGSPALVYPKKWMGFGNSNGTLVGSLSWLTHGEVHGGQGDVTNICQWDTNKQDKPVEKGDSPLDCMWVPRYQAMNIMSWWFR